MLRNMAVMLPLCKKFVCVRTFYIALIAFFAGFGVNFYFSIHYKDGVNYTLPRYDTTGHEGYDKREASAPSMSSSVGGDDTKVIFNVLPRTESKHFFQLMKDVALYKNRNLEIKHTMNQNLTRTYEAKIDEIREFASSPGMGFLYTYMRYYHFGDDTEKTPKYISIVSDPIYRLASHFNFIKGGNCRDGRKTNCTDDQGETFEDCVWKKGNLCKNKGDLISHFCGTDKHPCKSHARSSKAYTKAILNIQNNYIAVGTTDDFEGFLKILEKRLPKVFSGASQIYHQRKKLYEAHEKRNQGELSEEAKNLLMNRLTVDYRLYNFIKESFEKTKKELGITDLNSWIPR